MTEHKQYGLSTADPETDARYRRMLEKSFTETKNAMNRRPITRNEEARALIEKAWETCSGCRESWRLMPGTLNHRIEGVTFRCWAADERQQLRDLVKEMAK